MKLGSISVVNVRSHVGPYVYIGRGSPLGNPFPISKGRVACIREYNLYFLRQIQKKGELYFALADIFNKVMDGEHVHLGCFCKPKACHGDIIKGYLDKSIKEYKDKYEAG